MIYGHFLHVKSLTKSPNEELSLTAPLAARPRHSSGSQISNSFCACEVVPEVTVAGRARGRTLFAPSRHNELYMNCCLRRAINERSSFQMEAATDM